MSSSSRPSLYLAPAVNTTTVVTTTTTTTTYAPIPLPSLPVPSSPKDTKTYPLLNAPLPRSIRQFPLIFPGGSRATFREGDVGDDEGQEEEEAPSGGGWRQLKREEDSESRKEVGLVEAVERYGRKRSYSNEHMMEGIETTSGFSSGVPPRKKAKPAPPPQIATALHAAAPPSPLPSPHGSPPPENIWPSAPPSGLSSPQPQAPFQPDLSLTTLLTLPSLLSHFSNLPPQLQSHVLLTFLRQSPLPVLRTLHSVLSPILARDFLTLLPAELVSQILSYLPFSDLARASRVSKSWRAIIDSDPVLWRDLLKSTKIWFGGESELAFSDAIAARRRHRGLPRPGSLPLPHPYKILFQSRHLTRTRWVTNQEPKHIQFPAHGRSVVTCLIFSRGRIISASDDHSIHVYSTSGKLLLSLDGHEGGVWALAATKNTLVSGSTDRTVRIWDLETGRCTHVFGGHTSTVRCLAIVKPEWIDVENEGGIITREKWPKRPLIVTGSRDHSLRVWTLPKPGDDEYRCYGADDTEVDPSEEEVDDNPYHKLHLEGHDHAVRALAARGRTLVSGSYDCTVRIWDIITGKCKWTLVGHTQKVYSVVLDIHRNLACSGSMDGTVRVWNLSTGQCQHTLTGHTSLVGLLSLSPSYLVSAAADSTLRVWDPETGELRHTLAAHNGAITCFQHDEFKVLSGSDGTLKMWDIRDGSQVRDLLTGIVGVWQVVFEGRWCIAASNRTDSTVLDVWDFGNDEADEEWVGEPPGGIYDEDSDEYDDDDENEQADIDAMDEDLELVQAEIDDIEVEEQSLLPDDEEDDVPWSSRAVTQDTSRSTSREAESSSRNQVNRPLRGKLLFQQSRNAATASSSSRNRQLPPTDETPTRPRTRHLGHRRR
ncbi:putative E3 ubiquitin ligase complex SCF subunit sconB [Abortiporus biennis]